MNITEAKIKAAKMGFPEEELERENLDEVVKDAEEMLAAEDECLSEFDAADDDCLECTWNKICIGIRNEIKRRENAISIDDYEDEDEEDDDSEDVMSLAEAVQKQAEMEKPKAPRRKSWYKPKFEKDRFGIRVGSKSSFIAELMYHGKHTREHILLKVEREFGTVPEDRKGVLNNAQNNLSARGYTVRTDLASGIVRIVSGPGID